MVARTRVRPGSRGVEDDVAEIGGGGEVPNGEDLDPIPGDVASQMHDEGGVGVGVV